MLNVEKKHNFLLKLVNCISKKKNQQRPFYFLNKIMNSIFKNQEGVACMGEFRAVAAQSLTFFNVFYFSHFD